MIEVFCCFFCLFHMCPVCWPLVFVFLRCAIYVFGHLAGDSAR